MSKEFKLYVGVALFGVAATILALTTESRMISSFCWAFGPIVAIGFTAYAILLWKMEKPTFSRPAGGINATREWVDEKLNAKMANVMRVDGATHKGIEKQLCDFRLTACKYYLLLATSKSGRKIGRLFEGRTLGLAVTEPLAWDELCRPSLLTSEEEEEYNGWTLDADHHYMCNSEHTTSEDWGTSKGRREVQSYLAPAIIARADGMGKLVWYK